MHCAFRVWLRSCGVVPVFCRGGFPPLLRSVRKLVNHSGAVGLTVVGSSPVVLVLLGLGSAGADIPGAAMEVLFDMSAGADIPGTVSWS